MSCSESNIIDYQRRSGKAAECCQESPLKEDIGTDTGSQSCCSCLLSEVKEPQNTKGYESNPKEHEETKSTEIGKESAREASGHEIMQIMHPRKHRQTDR